jgi:hypothetical protein
MDENWRSKWLEGSVVLTSGDGSAITVPEPLVCHPGRFGTVNLGSQIAATVQLVPTLQASGNKVPSGGLWVVTAQTLGIRGSRLHGRCWSRGESWGKLRPTGEKLHMQKRDAAISRSWYATWMADRGW